MTPEYWDAVPLPEWPDELPSPHEVWLVDTDGAGQPCWYVEELLDFACEEMMGDARA